MNIQEHMTSGVTHLACFTSVNLASQTILVHAWTAKLNLEVKTSEMSRAWSHMFWNLRQNSFQTERRLVQMVDQNSSKFEHFQNLKKLHFI